MSEGGESDDVGKEHVAKQTRELPEGWTKNITGRRVDFPSEKGLSWGIEVSFSITPKMREYLQNIDITLPERIDTIRFLDMHPQESLEPGLENIKSDFPKDPHDKRMTSLSKLVGATESSPFYFTPALFKRDRAERTIRGIFKTIFSKDEEAKSSFNSLITSSSGNELLIVEGHGGGDPPVLGEQYPGENKKDEEGKRIQKKHNLVSVDELLKKYNDPKKYGAIVLKSCYIGTKGLQPKAIPLVYAKGSTVLPFTIYSLILKPQAIVKSP